MVESGLGRGFYSAVFGVRRANRSTRFAMKVIPVDFYRPRSEGGIKPDGKSIEQEIEIHEQLSKLPAVASYVDDGVGTIEFDGVPIECYWIQMELAEGPTLGELLEDAPSSAKQVAQIGLDLLSILSMLNDLGEHHNDLHPGNIIVTSLGQARRFGAIEPDTQVKVLDWGSSADVSRSDNEPDNPGDVRQVSAHILDLLDALARSGLREDTQQLNSDYRFASSLYSLFLSYGRKDLMHPLSAEDVQEDMQIAYQRSKNPGFTPQGLSSVASHYNATTLDAALVQRLLVDPGGEWERVTSDPGPLVITGMRGCGKTHLLKSFWWKARLQALTPRARHQLISRSAS